MSMPRPLLVAVAVAAAGCTNNLTIGDRIGTASVLPVTDLGVFPVGTPSLAYIEVTATRGDSTISNFSLSATGEAREYFIRIKDWLERPDADLLELPDDVAAFKVPYTIESDTTGEIPVIYYPRKEGFHTAALTLNTDHPVVKDVKGQVRAQADQPDAVITPYLVDFGQVFVGQEGLAEIDVDNRSGLPLVLNYRISDPSVVFSLEAAPFVVDPLSAKVFQLKYSPLREDPYEGDIIFSIGDEPVRRVVLRANDCERGDPDAYNRDGDGFSVCGGDCDDDDPNVHPGATEVVNNIDDDCDGIADDGTGAVDDDGDGYCDSVTACIDGSLPGDCNDNDPLRNPGLIEDCPDDTDPLCSDGIDNDCDRLIDGGTGDGDGDGYDDVDGGDCDDSNASVYPGARELADNLDNDCDFIIDEGTALRDDDGDGYCEGLPQLFPGKCTIAQPGAIPGDCDDSVDEDRPSGPHPGARIYPGASEDADEDMDRYIDNNCDGRVDEGTSWYDNDGDGYTAEAGDCDDGNPDISPGAYDIPGNGINEDCDNTTPVVGVP
ncbi:MAG: hypothetical protein H6732_16370 [Alphaproteobacteria bacterium]|nr:hypothetical protein [Alphaproteobacteria bacterium]